MLLWGAAGCGKTTLAATSPGKKLFIQFDPGGSKVIANRNDSIVLDLSDQPPAITDRLKSENPLGIEKFITENNIGTVVVDSLTTLSRLALENGIRLGAYKGSSIEAPGLQAYQHRNNQVLEIVKQLMRSTGKLRVNIVFIAHEDKPEVNDAGVVLYITLMLGGALPEYSAINIDEVWWMQDAGKERRIAIRPVRTRKPMKSRMFLMNGEPEFAWKYDADALTGSTIEAWYNSFVATGQRIPIPK